MIRKTEKRVKATVSFLLGRLIVFAFVLLGFAADMFAQNQYEMTLTPRRLGNQVGVEIWVKAIAPDVLPLGEMNIGVSYNGDKLFAASNSAANMPSSQTDAVQYDVDAPAPAPYYQIVSEFHNRNGFRSLYSSRPYGNDNGTETFVAVLNTMVDAGASNPGFVPASTGRGSFIGMLRFDIRNADVLTDADLAKFKFYSGSLNTTVIKAADASTTLTDVVDFVDPQDFTIRGITILNPGAFSGQTVNRYPNIPYQSMGDNHGYPIYFERSGLATPDIIKGVYGTPRYAYSLEYSLNNGASYTEFARIAENRTRNSQMTTPALLNSNVQGMVDFPTSDNDYYITTGNVNPLPLDVTTEADLLDIPDGPGLNTVGYGGVLRTIWKGDPNFPFRSETARLRISQIEPKNISAITSIDENSRPVYDESNTTRHGSSPYNFILGRLFFTQLSGNCQYLVSERNFSTPATFTVEAWINLNEDKGEGAEVGIVASSSGMASAQEGGWMLYLKDGKYPAFRVRDNYSDTVRYIGEVVSPLPVTVYSGRDVDNNIILDGNHSANWTHVAAIVNSNIVSLYVDGEKVDEVVNNQGVSVRPLQTKMPIWIGVNPNLYDDTGYLEEAFFTGGVKEVKVWRTALTQSDLRRYTSGVVDPTKNLEDIENSTKTALEIYYTFQGVKSDAASDPTYQWNQNPLNFFNACTSGASAANELLVFRPDASHIKLTSPSCGEGVSNIKGRTYEVRWVAFGVGSSSPKTGPGAGDVMIQVSRDGGQNWFDAIGTFKYDETTGGTFALPLDDEEVEASTAIWEPYNNVTLTSIANDLQGVLAIDENYAKTALLKISGTEANNQESVFAVSQPFTVAPHFALKNRPTTKMTIQEGSKLNITSQNAYIEAWIKPYTFPKEGSAVEYYPIITKKDPLAPTDAEGLHYALRLRSDGRLQFDLGSVAGGTGAIDVRTAISDPVQRILEPNVVEYDSVWVHVGVYLSIPENGTASQIVFYIDGNPQDGEANVRQLGSGIVLDKSNTYPTMIGYEDSKDADAIFFDGEMREVRFWRNNPAGLTRKSDPAYPNTNDLDNFIQGSLTVRANELGHFGAINYAQGLIAAYSMDGGSWVNSGQDNTVPVYPVDPELLARTYSACGEREYAATMPYIKLVEPKYAQSVENTEKELRVRWVGFDYNRNDLVTFTAGEVAPGKHADLGLSVEGGGGSTNRHYPPVASVRYNAAYLQSMNLPESVSAFEFPGTNSRPQFAALMDLSIANPDVNKDLVYSDQGAINAAAINGRFRLYARASINSPTPLEYDNDLGASGIIRTLMSESPSFTITPPSNFTLRMLLEGYHDRGKTNNIGRTFENNGVRIRFYRDNGGAPSDLIPNSTVVSTKGYTNDPTVRDPANRNNGQNNFANIPFVLPEVFDGKYYVVVDHQNYLPVMSAYPATFRFTGDDLETWDLESGWDFQSWNGKNNNYMPQADGTATPVVFGTSFAAYADDNNYTADRFDGKWPLTGLNYSQGGAAYSNPDATNAFAALVAGDVERDGQINAADRGLMRNQAGSSNPKFDLTGKGYSNAIDRTIVDHNTDKVSSLRNLALRHDLYPVNEAPVSHISDAFKYMTDANPLNVIDKNNPEQSLVMRENAIAYIENGGDIIHTGKVGNVILSGNVDYKVTATPMINNQYVDVPIYIQNVGGDWALANGTFAITYDPTVLSFNSMIQTETVIFDNRNDLGYLKAYTAPTDNLNNDGTIDPVANTRSIEINFDAYSKDKKGQNVPAVKTYLGTLRFNVLRGDESFIFDWSEICAVLDVEGSDVTSKGTFEVIRPIIVNKNIEIITPNGGEVYEGGSTNSIVWSYPNINKQVFIEYSTNNGSSWTKINSQPVQVTIGNYTWNTPRINSSQCLVRIVDANGGEQLARSKSVFSIGIAPTEITRPSSADPTYASGSKDFIKWFSNDKVSVYFEYSENGVSNWKKVTNVVNSDAGQVAWTLPTANTKSAHVRMVNAQNGEVLSVSTPFKILTGSFAINTPKAGDTYKANQKTQVRWTSANVTTFTLQFSKDAGSTWETLATDIKAVNRSWNWTIPNVNTKTAIIRAIYNNDPMLEYARTGLFTIENTSDIADDFERFTIASVTPNPVSEVANVTISVPNESRISVAIYNAAGDKIITLANSEMYSTGTHTLSFNASTLASGAYVVRMQVGNVTITKEFVKIK